MAEEGTRLADAHEGVSNETWAAVRKHYNDDEVGTLVCVLAMINAANRPNVIVRNPAGSYEAGMSPRKRLPKSAVEFGARPVPFDRSRARTVRLAAMIF